MLKEGTDSSQGVPQLISNINACQVRKTTPSFFMTYSYLLNIISKVLLCFLEQVIAEAVRTTLGPRGMDKLMVDNRGRQGRKGF